MWPISSWSAPAPIRGPGCPGVLSSARVLDRLGARCCSLRLTLRTSAGGPATAPPAGRSLRPGRRASSPPRCCCRWRSAPTRAPSTPSAGSPTDAVDLDRRADAVARLRERLDGAYAGRPEERAVDRAFADLVERHALPRALPEGADRRAGMGRPGSDLTTTSPRLRAYAARVAGHGRRDDGRC